MTSAPPPLSSAVFLEFALGFILFSMAYQKVVPGHEQRLLMEVVFGYPRWFTFVTACTEVAAALALLFDTEQFIAGTLLGGLVGGAMYSHVLRQRQPASACIPGVICVTALLAMWLRGTSSTALLCVPLSGLVGAAICHGVASSKAAIKPASWVMSERMTKKRK